MKGKESSIINLEKGNLFLPQENLLIGKDFTREQFLDSTIAQCARVHTKNEPWCSYMLDTLLDQHNFVIGLWFYQSSLFQISLFLNDAEINASYTEFSEEQELLRKERQEQWLKTQGIVFSNSKSSRPYGWDSISSVYDAKGTISSIVIDYKPAKMQWWKFW